MRVLRLKPALLILGAAVVALLPALVRGIPASRDLIHHLRLALCFFDAAGRGELHPGWLAEANGTFGELSPRFYPPGLSYLLVAGRAAFGQWYAATLGVFFVLTFAGGYGAYYWARNFVGPRYAMWAGVFYIFTPYHLNELYQSSVLAEYAAACVLPFVFAFTDRVCRRGGGADIAGFAAAYAGLMLTNTPLAVIASYALAAYALFRIERQERKRALLQLAGGVALGLLASACFWVTVVAELKWLRPDIEPANVFSWRLFLFSSFQHSSGLSIWYGNLIALATLAMALPALALWRHRARRVWLMLTVSFLMTTLVSYPLWLVLPTLRNVYTPWRWLAVTSLCAAVLAACSIPRWIAVWRSPRRPLALAAAGCVGLAVAFSLAHPVAEAQYLTRVQFDQALQNIPFLPSIGAWYPRWVTERFAFMQQPVAAPGRMIEIDEWAPEHRIFKVGPGAAVSARIRTFYYPLWHALSNGRELEMRPAEDGTMLIDLPSQAVDVDLQFQEPLRTRLAIAATLLGWLGICILAWAGRARQQKSAGRMAPS